jgi:hypothetical protein
MISSFWKLLGIRQAKMKAEKLGSVAGEFLNNIMVSFCEILLFQIHGHGYVLFLS